MENKVSQGEDRQIFYNMLIPGGAFLIVAIILGWILIKVNGSLPRTITFSGAVLVALASFRMIRGATYDKILRWKRELFQYDKTIVEAVEGGEKMVVKTRVKPGIRRAIAETIECVWCTGWWTTMIALFLYYLSPVTYIVLLLLALSGVASFIQLCANVAGNKYEILEKEKEKEKENERMGK
ncbi:MAG TPA: DUF1360 domain-containing protein [Candidatus Paceibacterota bacterium]|nr:DUF1360 domain-containing protein [Candidatus Paceibacterota bacterium]